MNKKGTIKQLEEMNTLVDSILTLYDEDISEKFIDKDRAINSDIGRFIKHTNKFLSEFCNDLEELKYSEDDDYAEDD